MIPDALAQFYHDLPYWARVAAVLITVPAMVVGSGVLIKLTIGDNNSGR